MAWIVTGGWPRAPRSLLTASSMPSGSYRCQRSDLPSAVYCCMRGSRRRAASLVNMSSMRRETSRIASSSRPVIAGREAGGHAGMGVGPGGRATLGRRRVVGQRRGASRGTAEGPPQPAGEVAGRSACLPGLTSGAMPIAELGEGPAPEAGLGQPRRRCRRPLARSARVRPRPRSRQLIPSVVVRRRGPAGRSGCPLASKIP